MIYTVGFLAWYSTTPFGLVPVGDEREIMALARAIAAGTLPHEAFYRAPGYPAVLASALLAGWPSSQLPLLARGINAVCHCLNAWLAARCAGQWWQSRPAGALAAALVGFNPVLLHFAGDALDITLAISLMLAGVCSLASGRRAGLATASGWFALAALCRPQLITLLAVPLLLARGTPGSRAATLLPGVLLLVLFGSVNALLSGDFRILPWQGAFNLWAANHQGANGRYFEQTKFIETYEEGANTARLESMLLYRERNPDAPDDYPTMTRWWQYEALREIATAPGAWLRLMGSKVRALIANPEQYNNKTYAFHKARSPWLAPNPLCWAVVFTLGIAGLAGSWPHLATKPMLACIGLVSAGVLLYYVSDRFRAPLVPLLSIAAGGLVHALRLAPLRTLASLIAALALSLLPGAEHAEATWAQDYLLLARSHAALGESKPALAALDAAAQRAPDNPWLPVLRCEMAFNGWLRGDDSLHEQWLAACDEAAQHTRSAALLGGFAAWHRGQRQPAFARWHSLALAPGPFEGEALAALRFAGAPLEKRELDRIRTLYPTRAGLMLRVMAALSEQADAKSALEAELGAGQAARELEAARRLWLQSPAGERRAGDFP